MTHGYLLSGTGSNVYVQSLCRELVRNGHEVRLLCQDPSPLSQDFVDEVFSAAPGELSLQDSRPTPYPGHCAVYRPRIGDLLPVYVYDDYPGWRVKTFLDLTQDEFSDYVEANVAALETVARAISPQAVITNHCLPGPLIADRALGGSVPHVAIVHGSALQYVARRSQRYMEIAREGLQSANSIVALSSHSASTVAEDFPDLTDRTLALPGGVDTGLFTPDTSLPSAEELCGGEGRGAPQQSMLEEIVASPPAPAQMLADRLRSIAASYQPRAHDADAGERLHALVRRPGPLVMYAGKLIHSKGVHSLLAAFSRVHDHTGAKLLVIGFGTFREALQALILAMSRGNEGLVHRLADSGTLLEGGPRAPMEHFEALTAPGIEEYVEFIGPLEHSRLARVFPAADAAVVPSIFPETFGLVAAEAAACCVPPFVADHSGLSEAGGVIGRGLGFDLRVGMDGFTTNLSEALISYLSLPEAQRRAAQQKVRANCEDHLSWGALATRIVELAGA